MSCSKKVYKSPKNPKQELILSKVDQIKLKLLNECDEENQESIKDLEVYFNNKNYAITANDNKSIHLPGIGDYSDFSAEYYQEYNEEICGSNIDCNTAITEYLKIYRFLHSTFHVINRERYKDLKSDVYVRKGFLNFRMSYDEEIKAELFLVAFLRKYHTQKLAFFENEFQKIIEKHQIDKDGDTIEKKWNNFEYVDIERDLISLSIFLNAKERLDINRKVCNYLFID